MSSSNGLSFYSAIDLGYDGVKGYCKTNKVYFKSRAEKGIPPQKGEETYLVNYEDIDYIVGEGSKIYSMEYDKTQSNMYKILLLTALHQLFPDEVSSHQIITSYPLQIFMNNRDIFSDYLKTRGRETFTLDGVSKRIGVEEVIVGPQTAPAIYVNDPEKIKGKTTGIIDIGGNTVQGCLIDGKLNIIPDSVFQISKGMIPLLELTAQELTKELNEPVSYYRVDELESYNDHTKEICKTLRESIVDQIVSQMGSHGWGLKTTEILGVGGGSLKLKDELTNRIKFKTSRDPLWDGVKGIFLMGEKFYAK